MSSASGWSNVPRMSSPWNPSRQATSLRLNDAVKPFTLLFDFPVGFVVVICFDDAAAIVWFVGAFKLSYHLVGVVERRFGDGAQIGELALILLPIGGAITAACLVDAQDHVARSLLMVSCR